MTERVRILPSGPRAFLAEYGSLDEVMHVIARVNASPPEGIVDIVPAARTILVTLQHGIDPRTMSASFTDTFTADAGPMTISPVVAIAVQYDGADLHDVARSCEMSVDDVVRLHNEAEYTVAFCGFVPGFSYLVGLNPRLHVPRRATPRTRVPAGSVAIASEFSAVYPADGPGGWNLIGSTDAIMWDDDRSVAALLPPGTRVRFVLR